MNDTIETRWEQENEAGRLSFTDGDFARAEQSFLAAIREATKLGADNVRLASSLSNLGQLKYKQKDFAQAEALFHRALAIRERVLGPEHFGLVQNINNLAALHYARNEFDQAEPLFQRALGISQQHLGEAHPDVAVTLNNLARLYFRRNEYASAGPLLRAAALDQGAGARRRATRRSRRSLTSLAKVRLHQQDYDGGEAFARRALEIREKLKLPNDLAVATALETLAEINGARGRLDEEIRLSRARTRSAHRRDGRRHPMVIAARATLEARRAAATAPARRACRGACRVGSRIGVHRTRRARRAAGRDRAATRRCTQARCCGAAHRRSRQCSTSSRRAPRLRRLRFRARPCRRRRPSPSRRRPSARRVRRRCRGSTSRSRRLSIARLHRARCGTAARTPQSRCPCQRERQRKRKREQERRRRLRDGCAGRDGVAARISPAGRVARQHRARSTPDGVDCADAGRRARAEPVHEFVRAARCRDAVEPRRCRVRCAGAQRIDLEEPRTEISLDWPIEPQRPWLKIIGALLSSARSRAGAGTSCRATTHRRAAQTSATSTAKPKATLVAAKTDTMLVKRDSVPPGPPASVVKPGVTSAIIPSAKTPSTAPSAAAKPAPAADEGPPPRRGSRDARDRKVERARRIRTCSRLQRCRRSRSMRSPT